MGINKQSLSLLDTKVYSKHNKGRKSTVYFVKLSLNSKMKLI